jgi:plasmid stabilization system protein ParE
MARVIWLSEGIEDVERLHAFLYEKDQAAASRAAANILSGSKLLAANPRIGRPMPDDTKRRELFIAYGAGAYVIRYIFDSNHNVVILRVWHSRENR